MFKSTSARLQSQSTLPNLVVRLHWRVVVKQTTWHFIIQLYSKTFCNLLVYFLAFILLLTIILNLFHHTLRFPFLTLFSAWKNKINLKRTISWAVIKFRSSLFMTLWLDRCWLGRQTWAVERPEWRGEMWQQKWTRCAPCLATVHSLMLLTPCLHLVNTSNFMLGWGTFRVKSCSRYTSFTTKIHKLNDSIKICKEKTLKPREFKQKST